MGATAAPAELVVAAPAAASAAPAASTPPNLVKPLTGFSQFWKPDGANDLHGSVVNAATLKRNDQLAVWINNNATKIQ